MIRSFYYWILIALLWSAVVLIYFKRVEAHSVPRDFTEIKIERKSK